MSDDPILVRLRSAIEDWTSSFIGDSFRPTAADVRLSRALRRILVDVSAEYAGVRTDVASEQLAQIRTRFGDEDWNDDPDPVIEQTLRGRHA